MVIDKRKFVPARTHAEVSSGETLRILREIAQLSQNDLAKLTHIAQPNISAIENGTSQMGKDRASIFAKALQVHPSVLLFPDGDISTVKNHLHCSCQQREIRQI